MVATYWPSTYVFNKLYLENLLAPLRHTFPITTFSRVDIYWPALQWGHDQSTVSVLTGYDCGHVCNLGTTLTKYFQKDKLVSHYYECYMMTSSNGNIFFAWLVLCGGNPPVNEGFPSQRPVKRLYDIQTRSHEFLHLFPVRTSNARNALRHRIPELLCKYPTAVLEKARTHSIMSFTSHVKFHLLDSYCSDCLIPQCYICSRLT